MQYIYVYYSRFVDSVHTHGHATSFVGWLNGQQPVLEEEHQDVQTLVLEEADELWDHDVCICRYVYVDMCISVCI